MLLFGNEPKALCDPATRTTFVTPPARRRVCALVLQCSLPGGDRAWVAIEETWNVVILRHLPGDITHPTQGPSRNFEDITHAQVHCGGMIVWGRAGAVTTNDVN
eukprot:5385817-Prymnesium_polylepis.1